MRVKKKVSKKTHTITTCAVLTALAMIFSYIENLLPVFVPVPGVKLGVANIAIITILYVTSLKEAVIVNLLRITLTALLFGNMSSFLFSISGAVFSMTIMLILKRINMFSMIGVSVCGAVMHNVGQILMAVIIMDSSAIIYYLPLLLISGIVTGIVIGIVSAMVAKRVKKAIKNDI